MLLHLPGGSTLYSSNNKLTQILQNVDKVLPNLSPDRLPLVIRKAFLLSGVQNSSRVGDRHTGDVAHTVIAGGESYTAHSKDHRASRL